MTQKKTKFKQEKFIRQVYSDRTGKWSFRVNIRYTDAYGRTGSYSKTFQESKIVSAKTAYNSAIMDRDRFLNQMRTVGAPSTNKYCVKNVFDQMIELSSNSFETKRKKIITFNKWVDLRYQNILIKELKASDIQSCLNEIKDNGCSKTIMNYICTIWKDICMTAIKYEYIYVDPFIRVDIPKLHIAAKMKDVNTDKETVDKVCDAIMKHTYNRSDNLFTAELICYAIQLCWYTGMRPAECFALEKKHIDFSKHVIYIRQSLGSSDRQTVYVRDTKTQTSMRNVPTTPRIEELLSKIIDKQKNDFLFADSSGKLINSNIASNKIARICKAEGIEFNMYRLRHQFSTDLIMSGHDARTVMELMGHNNLEMTYEYARSNNSAKLKALDEKE